MTDRVYELLAKPGIISKKIRQIDIQIEGLNMSMLPNGLDYDKAKVQSSPTDPMAEYAAKLDELNNKREDMCHDYIRAQDAVNDLVSQLTDENQKIILLSRYNGREAFSDIAYENHMSESNMFRVYRNSLSNLEKMIVDDSE